MTATGGRLIRIPDVAPSDLEAEEAVLGTVLLGGSKTVETLATEHRLRPEHFYLGKHARIFEAMLTLERQGETVDHLTVGAELEAHGHGHLRPELDVLAGAVPNLAGYGSYAATVVTLAAWRDRMDAGTGILEAVASLDEEAFEAAERTLHRSEEAEGMGVLTPERLAEEAWTWLSDEQHRDTIATPFPRLNEMLVGGLRPGATTIVAGWTSMGKSTFADQLLEHVKTDATKTRLACAYINEDSAMDRVARTLAGRTGVPFDRILGRDMSPGQWKRVLGELEHLPFAICPCAGWSAEDIARHVRRHRWDLFSVDLATLIPASTAAEWSEVSRTLTVAARQANSHGLVLVQLNQTRNDGAQRPNPALRDLKWTGAWADDAANVIFVHRDDVESAPGIFEPGQDGYVRLAKAKNGRPGLMACSLDPWRMRFSADAFAPREETIA